MYTHIQVIGYQTPTAVWSGVDWLVLPPNPGTLVYTPAPIIDINSQGNQGLINSIKDADLKARLIRFIYVINQAYAYSVYKYDDKCLKLFIAPEFYFRPNNSDLAYSYSEYEQFVKVVPQTLNVDGLEHWLFICGTIMYKYHSRWWGKDYIFNVAPVFKGHDPSFKRLIEKIHTSRIDGVPKLMKPENAYSSIRDTWYYKRWYSTDRVLSDYKLGIEICLEHGKGVLATSGKEKDINIHVIVSAGMTIVENNIATQKYVFINDGAGVNYGYDGNGHDSYGTKNVSKEKADNSDDAHPMKARLFYKLPNPPPSPPPAYNGRANVPHSESILAAAQVGHAVVPPATQGNADTSYDVIPQQIVFFESQPL
jgi:hypothetical protein